MYWWQLQRLEEVPEWPASSSKRRRVRDRDEGAVGSGVRWRVSGHSGEIGLWGIRSRRTAEGRRAFRRCVLKVVGVLDHPEKIHRCVTSFQYRLFSDLKMINLYACDVIPLFAWRVRTEWLFLCNHTRSPQIWGYRNREPSTSSEFGCCGAAPLCHLPGRGEEKRTQLLPGSEGNYTAACAGVTILSLVSRQHTKLAESWGGTQDPGLCNMRINWFLSLIALGMPTAS